MSWQSVQIPSEALLLLLLLLPHNGVDGEQFGCTIVRVFQRATAILPPDTTNPAAYKTIEDFQSDEVTKAGRKKEG